MSPPNLPDARIKEIGALLQAARERRGQTHGDVAFRIALSPSQLRAIELGDLRPFYSPNYFLQAAERYAQALGVTIPEPLEPAPVVAPQSELAPSIQQLAEKPFAMEPAVFQPTAPSAPHTEKNSPPLAERVAPVAALEEPAPTQHPSKTRPLVWVVLVAALVIVIGVTKISFQKPSSISKEELARAPAVSTALPSVAPVAPAAPVAAMAPTPPVTPTLPVPAPAPASAPVQAAAPPAVPTSAPTAAPALAPAAPAKTTAAAAPVMLSSDSALESQASTWVQIVKTSGEKQNLSIKPGQRIEFTADTTAAIVFGKPDDASLKIRGKSVDVSQFVVNENPPRALVILRQLRN